MQDATRECERDEANQLKSGRVGGGDAIAIHDVVQPTLAGMVPTQDLEDIVALGVALVPGAAVGLVSVSDASWALVAGALPGGGAPFVDAALQTQKPRRDEAMTWLPVLDINAEVLGGLVVSGAALDARQEEALQRLARHAANQLALRRAASNTLSELRRADRLATVGKLAAGIAHELGTPLSIVGGRARQIATGTVPADQVAPTARTIADQADRMAAIIRQLLDFARRREPRLGRFDIRTLVRQAVALLEPVSARKGVKLTAAGLDEARVVEFDGSQMMQVMINVISNAIHATPAGGAVTLSLTQTSRPPADSGLPARDYVGVVVSDTGSGIADEQRRRIFEPFFTTKDTGEGTGLGLSVAQGIVRDHRGWISVESELGHGSQFFIYLPA